MKRAPAGKLMTAKARGSLSVALPEIGAGTPISMTPPIPGSLPVSLPILGTPSEGSLTPGTGLELPSLSIGTNLPTIPNPQNVPNPYVSGPSQAGPDASIPELAPLLSIPGIAPYMTPGLIPDLINMYWTGAVHQLTKDLVPLEGTNRSIENIQRELVDILQFDDPDTFQKHLTSVFGPVENVQSQLASGGINIVLDAISRATPNQPDSIIFQSSLQSINQQTQKIQQDLSTEVPEVVERRDMQCVCGSRKIQVTPVQIRRADEPPHLATICMDCGVKKLRRSA